MTAVATTISVACLNFFCLNMLAPVLLLLVPGPFGDLPRLGVLFFSLVADEQRRMRLNLDSGKPRFSIR